MTNAETNLATTATLKASSQLSSGYTAANLTDGKLTNESRWVSASGGPHTLTLTWAAPVTLGCVQLATGWLNEGEWGSAFQTAVLSASGAELATVRNNAQAVVEVKLAAPVTTKTLLLTFPDDATVRLVEVRVFAPAASYPALVLPGAAPPRSVVPLLVNQAGYDTESPKRFTAPTLPDGTPFTVVQAGKPIFRGTVQRGVGDLTPVKQGKVVVIQAAGLTSDPFEIAPLLPLRASLDPALRFFVDNRSLVGTHPSAYGGCAWRDGTYYSYEVPSLVMLYLANPSFFDQAKREVRWEPLAADFKPVAARGDAGALEAARAYFAQLEPPKPAAPDLVKLIHWGVGWSCVKPESEDPSGDPKGRQVHPQTVEQLAFFLYAWPQLSRWLPESLYQRARALAEKHWRRAVYTEVGDFKGRECPGHSILPNLLLGYTEVALAQARWVCERLDPADPKVTKGQRMSEHMLLTGLTQALPHAEGLIRPWLARWADTVLARSENPYDFRKYDETNWTLPRFTAGSHGGAGWNEPGNVAGFPACALSVARVLGEPTKAARLKVIATAHLDALFGRNPLGAHAAYRGPQDFPGVERGWPKKFTDNTCARLELVRGTLSSTAASEHYPFNPSGAFRHPEGWTAFNAAFNVGLAYLCREGTTLRVKGQTLELRAPVFAPTATVQLSDGQQVVLRATDPEQTQFRGTLKKAVPRGTASYGTGFLATSVAL